MAVVGEAEEGPGGLRREKSSDMAVPTIQAPDGRRALPAFSSTETLARWRPDARPVAVPLRQALEALAHEKADTLLIDLAGPVVYELTGAALRAAGGTDPLEDPAVRDALRAAVAREPGSSAPTSPPGSPAPTAPSGSSWRPTPTWPSPPAASPPPSPPTPLCAPPSSRASTWHSSPLPPHPRTRSSPRPQRQTRRPRTSG